MAKAYLYFSLSYDTKNQYSSSQINPQRIIKEHLSQSGSQNNRLTAESGLSPVCVNQLSLEYKDVHLFPHGLWLFSSSNGRVENLQWGLSSLQNLLTLSIKFTNPYSTAPQPSRTLVFLKIGSN